MKYCAYCGAFLQDSAAPFCQECGHDLGQQTEGMKELVAGHAQSERNKPKKTRVSSKAEKASTNKKEKPPKPEKTRRKKKSVEASPIDAATRDDGYDGYYDDVKPADKGHQREGLEPELVKRIILVGVGFVVLVTLSIVVMYVL